MSGRTFSLLLEIPGLDLSQKRLFVGLLLWVAGLKNPVEKQLSGFFRFPLQGPFYAGFKITCRRKGYFWESE
jgi:hypothetical protein